jgi:uncharacterized membrane protein
MSMLITAAVVFLAIHFLIAGTRLRDVITGAIGEGTYLGLFSLASLVAIIWLCWAYNAAQASGSDQVFYYLGHIRDLGIIVVLIAFLLGVPGLMLPNPTAVRGDAAAAAPVKGVITITRHPFLWGVTIWSAFHLAANGDEASIILFGSFFVLALFGTLSIDAKRRRKMGSRWEVFAARTSNLPFAAALGGRTRVDWRGMFDWRLALALALFVIVLFGHLWAFKASPFPNGWRPH